VLRKHQGGIGTAIGIAGVAFAIFVYFIPHDESGSIAVRSIDFAHYYPELGNVPTIAPTPELAVSDPDWNHHCDEWLDWAAVTGTSPIRGNLAVSAQANNTSALAISRIEFDVHESHVATGPDRITCAYQADGVPSAFVLADLDVAQSEATLPFDSDADGEVDSTLPGGSFISSAGISEQLTVVLDGTPGRVYSFGMEVHFTENGDEHSESFGMDGTPLRVAFLDTDPAAGRFLDWDPTADAWTGTDQLIAQRNRSRDAGAVTPRAKDLPTASNSELRECGSYQLVAGANRAHVSILNGTIDCEDAHRVINEYYSLVQVMQPPFDVSGWRCSVARVADNFSDECTRGSVSIRVSFAPQNKADTDASIYQEGVVSAANPYACNFDVPNFDNPCAFKWVDDSHTEGPITPAQRWSACNQLGYSRFCD